MKRFPYATRRIWIGDTVDATLEQSDNMSGDRFRVTIEHAETGARIQRKYFTNLAEAEQFGAAATEDPQ
jgi:hypothetical protein